MKYGIVICSRYQSRRLPGKVLKKINGKPLLWHLIDRLLKIKKPVILAIPDDDLNYFKPTLVKYGGDVKVFTGSANDPLERMYRAAEHFDLEHVVRVTTDKIFIDHDCVSEMFNVYFQKGLDYAFSSSLPLGAGFEIISTKTLKLAAHDFKNVEHISYAVKATTINRLNVPLKTAPQTDARFLIDFPEDETFFQTLFACAGNELSLTSAIMFCNQNPWIKRINKQPKFTVYTCAYNAAETVRDTIKRIMAQSVFGDLEYIMIDDFSKDNTPLYMSQYAVNWPNIKYIRNQENIGLAASSNVALTHARGKYIMRIDADDYLTRIDALESLGHELESRKLDAIYPGFYDGNFGAVGDPRKSHHAAGALFLTRALNHIKFTDKLRNYDGYDLYLRARSQLDIGYILAPYFFYRHSAGSMSRTNEVERERVKKEIEAAHGL